MLRTLLAGTSSCAEVIVTMKSWASPRMSAARASGAPLWGMCWMAILASCLKISVERYVVLATPVDQTDVPDRKIGRHNQDQRYGPDQRNSGEILDRIEL